MPIITIIVGDILIALGCITYFGWEALGASTQSKTALIPAFIGLPLTLFGIMALRPQLRMHAMHGAVIVALLGFLASIGKYLSKPQAPTKVGPAAQLIMAAILGIYVALCVRSFISASRKRRAEAAAGNP